MIPIKYVIGDATAPQGDGRKIIAHVVNDQGLWGAGFVLALSAVTEAPEIEYRRWYEFSDELPRELSAQPPFELGEIQFAPFYDDIFVCNMLAQQGVHRATKSNGFSVSAIPLRYRALRHCLRKLAIAAHAAQATVHMPRIGCGLGGGEWLQVQPIIMEEVCAWNVPVTVYDLPAS